MIALTEYIMPLTQAVFPFVALRQRRPKVSDDPSLRSDSGRFVESTCIRSRRAATVPVLACGPRHLGPIKQLPTRSATANTATIHAPEDALRPDQRACSFTRRAPEGAGALPSSALGFDAWGVRFDAEIGVRGPSLGAVEQFATRIVERYAHHEGGESLRHFESRWLGSQIFGFFCEEPDSPQPK